MLVIWIEQVTVRTGTEIDEVIQKQAKVLEHPMSDIFCTQILVSILLQKMR